MLFELLLTFSFVVHSSFEVRWYHLIPSVVLFYLYELHVDSTQFTVQIEPDTMLKCSSMMNDGEPYHRMFYMEHRVDYKLYYYAIKHHGRHSIYIFFFIYMCVQLNVLHRKIKRINLRMQMKSLPTQIIIRDTRKNEKSRHPPTGNSCLLHLW